jgi:hypothetical protein
MELRHDSKIQFVQLIRLNASLLVVALPLDIVELMTVRLAELVSARLRIRCRTLTQQFRP